ncbi:MAG: hypothetical protein GW760_06420 [Legionella sp.]|jgi:hypothetical protein|nr:hypothetical protein [Legionella sp.]
MYYVVLTLPFGVFFGRLFLTNYAVPFLKKRQLRAQIATQFNAETIFDVDRFLNTVFKKNHSKTLSRIYRLIKYKNNREFIYGEIDLLAFHKMIEKAEPKEGAIFYDLGSGAGKAVFSAALYFDFNRCVGIELMDVLYKKSLVSLSKAHAILKSSAFVGDVYEQKLSKISFVKHDFLTYDFSDADIIYLAATCLSEQTLGNLINKISMTKRGTRVMIATKKIDHDAFELVYDNVELMGWGLCHFRIYRRV